MYYKQGGLEDVNISQVHTQPRFIIGKSFEGNVRDTAFPKMFKEIRELKEDYNLKGSLGTIYYNNPKDENENIKAFFGVFIEDQKMQINNYQILQIASSEYIQGNIKASSAFVHKTYSAIFDYAEKNKITLDEEYIEWFPSENEIFVQIKIKK